VIFTEYANNRSLTNFFSLKSYQNSENKFPISNLSDKSVFFFSIENPLTESQLLSQPSSISSSPTKGTTKISHVVLLSAERVAKTKSGIKRTYFDWGDGDDFIIK
jgi:hypothetical protein